ncbi:hypothetical protein J4E91_007826 [Alternaria rosae]|nr:hypothetical protein J4E91_007826 [Alternaria rosae]
MSSNLKTTTTQDACKLKIEEFQKDIESSVQRAFLLRANPGSSGYKKVVVQFMHFASNDIAGIPELEKELGEVFKKVYLYDVKYAKIGASKKHASVSLEVSSLLNDLSKPEAYGSVGNLVILVYSGHGENVKHHGVKQLRVSGTSDGRGPNFFWKSAVSLLDGFQSDVIQILDCCYAAEAFSSVESEYLTACSATEIATADIATSFTKAIIEQLKICNGQPWTTSAIYSRIVRNKEKFGLVVTPNYLPRNDTSFPIILRKLGNISAPPPITDREESEEPRVIITAHIEDKITADTVKQLKIWLETRMPAKLLKLKVEFAGVYDTDSSLLEFRIPVVVWAMLRDDPAYRFVGFSRSGNRLLELAQSSSSTTLVSQPVSGYENMKPGSPSK